MLTVRDIQAKTVAYFASKGVPNPKLDTDLLIAEVLGIKRLELYLDIDRPLIDSQLDILRPMVKRRANREPLQYILGYGEFCGMKLEVEPAVLIPRQETEELIELIRDRLTKAPKTILDLGTGSGAIAVALAQVFPEARIFATDQSAAALEVAKRNAKNWASGASIEFLEGSWFECIDASQSFELIVSNPPYLTEAEMETAEPEVVANEPSNALVSGKDGLDDLRIILSGAREHLSQGGSIALETGVDQHEKLDQVTKLAGLSGQGVEDMSGRPRFYFAQQMIDNLT